MQLLLFAFVTCLTNNALDALNQLPACQDRVHVRCFKGSDCLQTVSPNSE